MAEILFSEDAVQQQSPGHAVQEQSPGDAVQEQSPGDDLQGRLKQAANEGNIDELYSLIGEDVSALDNIDKIPFVETPLHIAASKGHTLFAIEIMRLKPSFARKLDTKGNTPIHLALENNKIEVIHDLIKIDKDLVRIKGRGGLTPLHYAAQVGQVDLLSEFLYVCPESILDVTIWNETALHIALEHKKIEAFNELREWLYKASFKDSGTWEDKLLKWKNEEGKTFSEIAKEKDPSLVKHNVSVARKLIVVQREFEQLSEEARSALLVVIVLLVTVTLQATLTPPGGTWQDDSERPANDFADKPSHRAGTAIMSRAPFLALTVFNVLSLFYTFFALHFLLPRRQIIDSYFLSPICSLVAYFIIAIFVTYPSSRGFSSITFSLTLGLVVTVIFSISLVILAIRLQGKVEIPPEQGPPKEIPRGWSV